MVPGYVVDSRMTQHSGRDERREQIGGAFDVLQIGCTVAQRRRHGDHGDSETREQGPIGGRSVALGGERRAELGIGDVVDERGGPAQPLDPLLIDVEADDVEADLHGPDRHREPDVALPEDDHLLDGHDATTPSSWTQPADVHAPVWSLPGATSRADPFFVPCGGGERPVPGRRTSIRPSTTALQPLREVIAGDPALAERVRCRPASRGAAATHRCRCARAEPVLLVGPAPGPGRHVRLHRPVDVLGPAHTPTPRVVEFPEDPVMDWLVTSDGALTAHGEQATRARPALHPAAARHVPARAGSWTPRPGDRQDEAAAQHRPGRPRLAVRPARRRTRRRPSRPPARAGASRRRPSAAVPGRVAGTVAVRAPWPPERSTAMRRCTASAACIARCTSWTCRAASSAATRIGSRITAAAGEQIAVLVPSTGDRVGSLLARLALTVPDDADRPSARATSCRRRSSATRVAGRCSTSTTPTWPTRTPRWPPSSVALGKELHHRAPTDADARATGLPRGVPGAGRRIARSVPLAVVRARWRRCATSLAAWSRAERCRVRRTPCSIDSRAVPTGCLGSDAHGTSSAIERTTARR